MGRISRKLAHHRSHRGARSAAAEEGAAADSGLGGLMIVLNLAMQASLK